MGEFDLHSFISACELRVEDVNRMWKWPNTHREPIGSHHVLPYIWEPGGVMVTMGTTQFVGNSAHLVRIGERV
ncbi:hypothetical protein Mycsm_03337 [Mycobacterium sp. JS623]|uniref:hypothetical protein n=1 Tax=Mycobacterium sp. JS623 TaxID=212767 RepID=UPI0002A5502E|nr:hypothetical protein [Mycobacterium sp. JS623]AGB23640.1 hypothetical protein Mycsm_03337 [Mycobacterium sp. JS623]